MNELSGTGRHLNTEQLRLWTSLVDASRILDTELEQQLIEHHGMSHREYEILVRIDGAGGRKRMSALAREIEASAPLISQTVGRLEARGWIVREAAAADGRGVEAVLSPAGRKALADAAEPHAALLCRLLFDHIATRNLGTVADELERVADHMRLHRSGGTCTVGECPLDMADAER